ncbi:MAG TPA: hypothetical protein VK205_16795 [Prolixibacteraceae bacterium]|nr:hypothetical protein [Prolixibacteraceae bacterium]
MPIFSLLIISLLIFSLPLVPCCSLPPASVYTAFKYLPGKRRGFPGQEGNCAPPDQSWHKMIVAVVGRAGHFSPDPSCFSLAL